MAALTRAGGVRAWVERYENRVTPVFEVADLDRAIELAERLIAHFLPLFVFTAEVRPNNVYWIDAAKAAPPGSSSARVVSMILAPALSSVGGRRDHSEDAHTIPRLGSDHESSSDGSPPPAVATLPCW